MYVLARCLFEFGVTASDDTKFKHFFEVIWSSDDDVVSNCQISLYCGSFSQASSWPDLVYLAHTDLRFICFIF